MAYRLLAGLTLCVLTFNTGCIIVTRDSSRTVHTNVASEPVVVDKKPRDGLGIQKYADRWYTPMMVLERTSPLHCIPIKHLTPNGMAALANGMVIWENAAARAEHGANAGQGEG